jgi:signal transduction histidine kinase
MTPDNGKANILVVDDETTNIKLLMGVLEKHGYEVRTALDGRQAIASAVKRVPDLILLDVRMPEMDGFEACRQLKTDERTRLVPIIFLSALGQTADIVQGLTIGGADYIVKPFRIEEVLARVETHLSIQALQRQLLCEIQERKRAEEKLNEYREHLEELVRGRTAQLEAANKEMHDFTYTVSHDLRAPLRHIDGFIALLQKKAGTVIDEQRRHYMDAVSDAAQKMGLLIDELLSFSRMGRGQAPSFQNVALEEMVPNIIGEFNLDTRARKIDWRIGNLPVVRGDEAMLRVVLVNLISNALKFTRSREKATIEIGSLPDQTSETVIYVRDNGVGFDMTYADKLFGVFQRLHHADEFEGTGIGLAKVRRIIAQHGGRTWGEGEPDQGAVFYFALPRQRQEGVDERPFFT